MAPASTIDTRWRASRLGMRMWSQVQVVEERHERVACAVSGGDSDAPIGAGTMASAYSSMKRFSNSLLGTAFALAISGIS